MTYYRYDKETKEFEGEFTPQIDPLESIKQQKTVYMFPQDGITDIDPPSFNIDEKCFFQNGKWEVYGDVVVYNKETRNKYTMNENEYDREIYTIKVPQSKLIYCTWNGTDWVVDQELKASEEYEEAIRAKEKEIIRRMAIKELEG